MQTVLVIFLLFSLSVLGYPDSNQNINTIDEEHQKIVEDLQQRSVQCAKEKQKLGAQIKALKKLLKDKNTTLEDTLEIIESCKKRNVHYLTTNQMVTKQNKILKDQVEECTASKQETDRYKEEAVQKLEECSSEKEAQDRALEAQNYDIKEKERKIAECEQKNKIIQNNNDELDSIAAELENDIERAQSKATDIRSKLKQPSSVRMG
ncbi:GYF domain-containing protein gyf-1-like isoform X1 [Cydia pomonella]|uniref:GYF domain-containing protein gyf-1-like isoform X1 n=1 Tax=Cydia pomonella TaxID=82600 RepID=UPI002ADE552D|nr:GYF domain-containing protein gyf-1-like isoform X1 [Cydia pomonella]